MKARGAAPRRRTGTTANEGDGSYRGAAPPGHPPPRTIPSFRAQDCGRSRRRRAGRVTAVGRGQQATAAATDATVTGDATAAATGILQRQGHRHRPTCPRRCRRVGGGSHRRRPGRPPWPPRLVSCNAATVPRVVPPPGPRVIARVSGLEDGKRRRTGGGRPTTANSRRACGRRDQLGTESTAAATAAEARAETDTPSAAAATPAPITHQ